jgi:hypothetical protein
VVKVATRWSVCEARRTLCKGCACSGSKLALSQACGTVCSPVHN